MRSVVDNGDGTFSVPYTWRLIPDGLKSGAKFRLLFVTSTTQRGDGSSSDIATYDAQVQAVAAQGTSVIVPHASAYKAVASTSSVDARDHIRANPTNSAHVVAPVYWMDGARVSRNYGSTAQTGFWSSAWENWTLADRRDSSRRAHDFTNGPNLSGLVWTGTNEDGTRHPTAPLGSANPRLGDTDGNNSPISSTSAPNSSTAALYGISPVYVVADPYDDCDDGDGNGQTAKLFVTASSDNSCHFFAPAGYTWKSLRSIEVLRAELADGVAPESVFRDQLSQGYGKDALGAKPVRSSDGTFRVSSAWPLVPDGLGVGDKFRLLFVTSTAIDASSANIGVYDAHVRARAAAGDPDIQGHSSAFRAVASTPTVDARDHIRANPTNAAHVVAPVYWLGETRVSRNYGSTDGTGFWAAAWENRAVGDRRDEFGESPSGSSVSSRNIWTGTLDGASTGTPGTKSTASLGGSGSTAVVGDVANGMFNASLSAQTELLPLYGISPVYVIAESGPVVRQGMDISDPSLVRHRMFYDRQHFAVTDDNGNTVGDSHSDVAEDEDIRLRLVGGSSAPHNQSVVNALVDMDRFRKYSTDKDGVWLSGLDRVYLSFKDGGLCLGVGRLSPALSNGDLGFFWGRSKVARDPNTGNFVEGRTAACVQVTLRITMVTNADEAVRVLVRLKDNHNGAVSVLTNEYPTQNTNTPSTDTTDTTDNTDTTDTTDNTDNTNTNTDTTDTTDTTNSSDDSGSDGSPTYVVPAQLVADVQGYAAETSNGDAHVNRWKRVLVAFGEDVPGFGGTAMSAAEAKQHAQTFWSVRWDPVADALTALEAQPAPQTNSDTTDTTNDSGDSGSDGSPSYVVPAQLVADVQGYAAETSNGDAHVNRWKRVLVAFGEDVPGFGGTAMSAAEAKQHAQTFWSVRWDPVADALTALEAQAVPETSSDDISPPPVDPVPVDPVPVDPVPVDPVVDPTVSVTAGSDVTEGGDAVFTLTASPAPAAPLTVTVDVTASGGYGVTAGTRTVTVPTTGTATLSVATTDDSTDEANGSVTATVTDGTGYDPDSSAATATVNVTDNDDPPPPPPPAANLPAFSVTDGVHTEGSGYYFFFVTLDKPVNKPTRVSYTVEATGNGPGHATAGTDFVSTTRTIFFRPGLIRNVGLVIVRDDSLKEPNETLRVVLSNPQGATIGRGTATITIKDND